MKVAVIGHVEWVEFLPTDAAPAPGRILHTSGAWEEPAGGGGVAAVELARLAGHCTLFTSFGADARGQDVQRALAEHAVDARGPTLEAPHRRAMTLIDPDGERTIIVHGEAQGAFGVQPGDLQDVDAVYVCKGDLQSLRAAREARVVVATSRIAEALQQAGLEVDVLISSADDPKERFALDRPPVPSKVCVATEGAAGGRYRTSDGQERPVGARPPAGPFTGRVRLRGQLRGRAHVRVGRRTSARRGSGVRREARVSGVDPSRRSRIGQLRPRPSMVRPSTRGNRLYATTWMARPAFSPNCSFIGPSLLNSFESGATKRITSVNAPKADAKPPIRTSEFI